MTLPPLPEAGMLDAALAALLRLDAAGPDRADETGELRALRAAHPGRRVRLLHQRESLDGSVARALLLTGADGGAVSLSWTPPSTVPWVMRGAQRVEESVLLTVDGVPLSVEDGVALLDVLWQETALLDRLVNACLVRRVLAEDPVELGPADLQAAVDAFRRARGLLTAEDTVRWLGDRGLTAQGLEDMARWEAELAGLRDRVTAPGVDAWLAEHPRAGGRVRRTEVTVAHPALAQRLAAAARSGSLVAAAAAELAAGTALTVTTGEVAAADLPGAPGALAPGLVWCAPAPDGAVVVEVTEVLEASPAAARREARDALFAAWLADRRRSASVRWGWGDTASTDAATGTAAVA
ncbi:TIGR04500 family putative peptide maturation system protein [Blastococcus litoris]|uniref:TIGR04500 family putative peptide maturation system protein n=1 Tax=Blastococcus litoris TaxID=2171622 RepID=UPI000E3001FA|nr:TIGR04500 family putative peptide maturation system protein [Blastococcus litoris]